MSPVDSNDRFKFGLHNCLSFQVVLLQNYLGMKPFCLSVAPDKQNFFSVLSVAPW